MKFLRTNDLNSISVVVNAVEQLQIKDFVVCGHYFYGGVKAAMQDKDLGVLNPWPRIIRYV
jgi:carbonic anhydrase